MLKTVNISAVFLVVSQIIIIFAAAKRSQPFLSFLIFPTLKLSNPSNSSHPQTLINTHMRTINTIILHCSASIEGVNLSGNDIRCMHCNPVRLGGRGWRNPGYHYVVRLDGTVDAILPIDCIANGVKGHNADAIHICYVGGLRAVNSEQLTVNNGHPVQAVPANTMTTAQRLAIRTLLAQLHDRDPSATLHGHREFAAKACPCFDVRTEFPEFCHAAPSRP